MEDEKYSQSSKIMAISEGRIEIVNNSFVRKVRN